MKPKYKKYIGKEDDFQKSLASYLDSLNVLWFHSPNEIKAKPQYMVKRREMGVKSGVPDVCILEPNRYYHGLFIELKVGYNKTSDNQKKWVQDLNERGYKTCVSYSLDECIEIVNNYINYEKVR